MENLVTAGELEKRISELCIIRRSKTHKYISKIRYIIMDFYCSKQAKKYCATSILLIICLVVLNIFVMSSIEKEIETIRKCCNNGRHDMQAIAKYNRLV
jgi:hypothetical protein